MTPELAALEARVAALESNRIPLDMDAVNKKNLAYLVGLSGSVYAGYCSSDASSSTLPDGWSVSLISTGQYRVVHNLGIAYPGYAVSALVNTNNTRAMSVDPSTNDMDIFIGNASNSAGENNAFFFILKVI